MLNILKQRKCRFQLFVYSDCIIAFSRR